ncbi:ester cyclase [Deinococcus sp. Arct2-2]|uniref:ester cyclase n=1 Tax=Deinococcus sp. Arct2-2 TaxID=2568653 RepID=UPI0010A53B0A|nr:ester cyclase [Deinococcus sp. Arct2-2]THF70317.1 ester cyclase [Deinococcus sp. Arct2-2]
MSNKNLAYRFAQSLTERDEPGYASLLHPDYVNHNAFAAPGKDGSVSVFFQGFVPALPDFRVTVEDVYEDGDTLIARFKYSGTFTHPLMGYVPTGQPIEMRSIDIWRVQGGLLAEHWDELNTLEVFVQMGAATLNAPAAPEVQA